MIAEFLRQEYASYSRYGTLIDQCLERGGVSRDVLMHPDIGDPVQNRARRRVLGDYRGYGQPGTSFFTDFPASGVAWSWAVLHPGEILSTLFIRYWADIWRGGRDPRELARRINEGDVPDWALRDGTIGRIRALAEAIAAGGPLPPPLILVSADDGRTKVAMEGSTRLTAYALAETSLPAAITVLIGCSPGVACWDEY